MVIFLAGAATGTALADATSETEVFTVPFATTVGDNPCTGEAVTVTGELRFVVHTTVDATGGFHSKIVIVPTRASGVGETTGTRYVYAGATTSAFNLTGPPQNTVTDTFTTVVASKGSGGNLIVTGVFHETVSATGEVTAFVDNVQARCTG